MKSVSTIRAKFKRLNVTAANTSLWDDVNEDIKAHIEQQIHITKGEIKVLFVLVSPSYWWVLTNQRLILSNDDSIEYLNLTDIKNVEPRKLFKGVESKKECRELNLDVEGCSIELIVEENTWHSIYNILKFVISK